MASVMGRYYAMDRDNRWDRVEKAYRALVFGEGETGYKCHRRHSRLLMTKDVTDEFCTSDCCQREDGAPVATIKDNDSVIFFNFRPDRAREITRTFCDDAV